MMPKKQLPLLTKLKKQYIQTPYNIIADVYHKKHFNEKFFDPFLKKFTSMLKPGSLVLDAGCGTGGESKKLIRENYRVKSIDISDKMLKKAKAAVPGGEFIKMDFMRLNFPDNFFDGLWSSWAIIHVPSKYLKTTLRGFSRVLKINGVACFIVIKGEGEKVEPENYDKTGKTKVFFKYFQTGELEKILRKIGFKIIQSKEVHVEKYQESYIVVFAKKVL